ncbi:MAG: hypothetical protein JO199_03885 [Candidatus Eremiobacteraeota bacterium]|nr:hypothetical protein [Candidatus Eremiobacteraeota bacterium]
MDSHRDENDEIALARERVAIDIEALQAKLDFAGRAKREIRYRLRYPRAIATVLKREALANPGKTTAIAGAVGAAMAGLLVVGRAAIRRLM